MNIKELLDVRKQGMLNDKGTDVLINNLLQMVNDRDIKIESLQKIIDSNKDSTELDKKPIKNKDKK